MIHCTKCGVEVDTLAKRRHRCRKKRLDQQTRVDAKRPGQQLIFGFYRGKGFGPRPYLRKRRK